MADDSRIVITAGLDIVATVDQINRDLKKVQSQLNKLIVSAKFDKKVEKDINNLTRALTRLQQLAEVARDQTIRINAQDNGVSQIVQRLDELTNRVNQINQTQLDMRADRAVNEMQNVNNELQTVNVNAVNARQSLVDMLGNVGIHLSAYQALRLIRQGIKEITDAVKEYDEYVTNLRIITQQSPEAVNNMLAGYADKAMKLGVDVSEYEKAAETILRTGQTAEDTDKILRDSVLLSKVGFIDSEKAASNIVTIANAYGLEADNMERVVDSLLSLDTTTLATGGALSSAAARTAKNAQLAGVSLDSLVSQIANLRNLTGKEEEQIATSLNSIYSRMYNVKLGKFIIEDESGIEDITEDISDMEKILSRVGVKLREDKGTFREFDDIIRDLHDNWSKFNDVERSAIAKTIGGTYHKNVSLALIEGYEDFQKLQEVSLQSAGTASERYEAYTDSIAAKSAELSTALKQMWSNTISSEGVKDIKEATTSLVQFLDKYEVLQNLLKTGLIYGAARGFIYLGGTLQDAYVSMRSLSQAFNSLTMMRQNAYGTTGYNTAINNLMVSTRGLTNSQIELLFSTNQLSQAQMMNILQARGMSQQEAATTIATMGLATAEEGATATTWSLAGAFRALGTALTANPLGVISVGLMGVFSVMTVLKNKTEEQEQAQQELEKQTEQSIAKYKDEINKLDELTKKYAELSSKSRDLKETREGLTELQAQITDGYGGEASGIDLVNGKYSEQINKLYELKKAKADLFITDQDNIDRYKQSLKALNEAGDINGGIDVDIAYNGGIPKEVIEAWKRNESVLDVLQYTGASNKGYGITINNGNDAETLYKTLEEMAKIYKELTQASGDYNEEQYTAIKQQAIAAKESYDKAKEFVDLFENFHDISEFELTGDVKKQFDDLINEAVELNQVLNGDTSEGDKYIASKRLEEVQKQLRAIAGESPELTSIIETTFNSLQYGTSTAEEAAQSLHDRWIETLDDMEKNSLKSVDNMIKALQDLSEGKFLSHDAYWDIAKLDEDGLLGVSQMTNNGEFYVEAEKLISLKDAIITKQLEALEDMQISSEETLEALEAEKEKMLEQLEVQKEITEAKAEGKGVSTPEFLHAQEEIRRINVILQKNEASQKAYNKKLRDTNVLIAEWRSKLGDTVNLPSAAQAAVDKFEQQLTAIEDTTERLKDRKKVLEDEKKDLQSELDILNKQKESLEETIKNYDSAADAVDNFIKTQTDGIQAQIDALEDERKAVEDSYNDQIDALKKSNEERDIAYKKEKALLDLENAKNQKVRTYDSARGWTYEAKKEDVVKAQKGVDDVVVEEKIYNLETERDSKLKGFDERKTAYENQITAYQKYAKQYTDIANDIKKAENELTAEQILGADWREKIEQQDETLLSNYRSQYQQFNNDLKQLVNTEIANLKASIEAKDEEIKKISDEISAYNDYKTAVQKNLTEAKNELKNYKEAVSTIKTDILTDQNELAENAETNCRKIGDAYYQMQDKIWENSGKIQTWYDDVGNAAERLRHRLEESSTGFGIVNSAWDERLIRGYANGGTVDYTGLAMVHGSHSSAETTFNASDSKKLYDLVHQTPNLLADVAKQATQAKGISNITNSNTNSNKVDIHIGQVVANNPQQFTQGLDRELETYFRRKLTESYVQ